MIFRHFDDKPQKPKCEECCDRIAQKGSKLCRHCQAHAIAPPDHVPIKNELRKTVEGWGERVYMVREPYNTRNPATGAMVKHAWSRPYAHKRINHYLRACEVIAQEADASTATVADRLHDSWKSISDIFSTMSAETSFVFLINMMKALAVSRRYVVTGHKRLKGVLVHCDGETFSVRVRKDETKDPTPGELRGPPWMFEQWETKKLTLELARAIDVEFRLVPNQEGPHPSFQPGVPIIARYLITHHDLAEKEKRHAGQPNV